MTKTDNDDPLAITLALLPDDQVQVRDFEHGGTRPVPFAEWLRAERRRIALKGGHAEIAAAGPRIYLRKGGQECES